MSLPKAIASGPSTETPDAVRAVRVAVGAGVLAALYLVVFFLAQPVPTRLLALYGGAANAVERYGGLEMRWQPPSGMSDDEVVQRFRAGDNRTHVRRDGDVFVISMAHVTRDQVDGVAKYLGGEDGLEFHRVVRVDAMKQLAQILSLPMTGAKPVDIDVDQWHPDDGDPTRTDYYLIGSSREAIESKLVEAKTKGWRLPEGMRIAWESFDGDTKPMWRTYVIDERAELDGADIADAFASFDPNTNRPLVLLDFTEAGATKFAQLTSEIVGEKLAATIGNTVYSAPIINGPITGGRASITMGGNNQQQQHEEREALVDTLRTGALPKGGKTISARYVAPADDALMQWLARGTLALAGGVVIALLSWIVVRVTRPVRRQAVTRADAPPPWSRLIVTLLAPVAVYVVSKITVLGISRDELVFDFGGASYGNALEELLAQVNLGALGIMPIISAFILVEVLALIFPGWRRRRHAGPDARAPLTAAVAITGGTLLVLQGWFVTQYLTAMERFGATLLEPGALSRVLVIGSFAVGTLVLAGVAASIRRYGLGNGYGVLLLSGWSIQIGSYWLEGESLIDADVIVAGATALAIAIPLITVARWRIVSAGEAPLRLPTSGVAPLADVGGLVLLIAILSKFQLDGVTLRLWDWTQAVREHPFVLVGGIAALTLLWSFAFARPSITRKLAEGVGAIAPSYGTWWRATAISAGLLLLVGAIATLTTLVRPTAAWLAEAVTIALVAMVALDIYDDWRARRVRLDRVWTVHQPQHAELVVRALETAGIPCHLASANLRTLLAFFGPFAPIDVLVPTEHAPAARERLRALVE